MASVDIVISNDRHHVAMAMPLAALATRRGHECRILSLCEFRGIATPREEFEALGVRTVVLSRIRRPRRVQGKGRGNRGRLSNIIREAVWRWTLAGNVKKALKDQRGLVILFNDAAYPYDRLCRLLRDRSIPFLLVQEGIRYDVADSAQEGSLNQGKGGASAIAAWGESSAEYFKNQGAPAETLHLTGNPRFDRFDHDLLDLQAQEIRMKLDLPEHTVLFLSNPIEFHGYCTADEKMRLVSRFIESIDPILAKGRTALLFKLHGHEDRAAFEALAESSPHADRILFATNEGLYPLLKLVDGAVIFSTTAGLEAMLFGVPLGVLEIPGTGFLHDYVESGAAVPLNWGRPMADQVEFLLAQKGKPHPETDRYLDRTLAVRSGATEKTIEVAEGILEINGAEPSVREAVG